MIRSIKSLPIKGAKSYMAKMIFQPSVSELLDRLTVDQIKMIKDPEHAHVYNAEMKRIHRNLESILKQKKVTANATFIRHLIALAQVNLHIWQNREIMQNNPKKRQACLKLTHQLNGLRNQIKNRLLLLIDKKARVGLRSYTGTDRLKGWRYSILET